MKKITVSWVLIDGDRWCRDKTAIESAIKLGHAITLVNDEVIRFMNACDLMHYLSGYSPIYKFTEEQWKEGRENGWVHG